MGTRKMGTVMKLPTLTEVSGFSERHTTESNQLAGDFAAKRIGESGATDGYPESHTHTHTYDQAFEKSGGRWIWWNVRFPTRHSRLDGSSSTLECRIADGFDVASNDKN
jgi:hypothetical protein